MYLVSEIAKVVGGKLLQNGKQLEIEHLGYDSRRMLQGEKTLFFALITSHADGHLYIKDAYHKGVRSFVISKESYAADCEDCNVILVPDTLKALQALAAFHRSQFKIPVIGITGSNGKTIVKEWLYQLLQKDYNIVRSPKSFNSQVGVPLSLWQMNEEHNLAIFEAGISTIGEMEKLEQVIRPTIGILTNIGEAHDEGFRTRKEKACEKLELFRRAEYIIYPHESLQSVFGNEQLPVPAAINQIDWCNESEQCSFRIIHRKLADGHCLLKATYKGKGYSLQVPFTDDASIENAINCWCLMIHLGYEANIITDRFKQLHKVEMRLQLVHAINNCLLINDSYSADITSLQFALQFLVQQSAGLKRTVIISDFFQSGKEEKELYAEIIHMLIGHGVEKVIAIGGKIGHYLQAGLSETGVQLFTYPDTESFTTHFKPSRFLNETILVKGARVFRFEEIVALFESKRHQTVLEINLNALAQNLKEYRKLLRPSTKLMAMVKAFSYGSGSAEIASVLQFNNVDYLGVAYADEGIELVKSGLTLPIMVMNAEESSFAAIVEYNLQPVIYSFDLLYAFESYLDDQGLYQYPVHLEVETGMNRLGFQPEELEIVGSYISASSCFHIMSLYSHLAASEEAAQDEFTRDQFDVFQSAVSILEKFISYPFIKHICNSAGIVRHPGMQLDMVRLGIGLYGIESDEENQLDLTPVTSLRTTIAQLKRVKKGDSVSYNRRGVVDRDSLIATVRIGYADGYSRQFSNGKGWMLVRGQLVPVIGSICMDMTMLDVTDVKDVSVGDDVVVFGNDLPVQKLASWINTIPYEILTSVSQRVKRVYFFE